MALIDLVGQRFGRMFVIGRSANKGRRPMWHCECDCGVLKTVQGGDLRSGATLSCGCMRAENSKNRLSSYRNDPLNADFYVKNTQNGSKVLADLRSDPEFLLAQAARNKKMLAGFREDPFFVERQKEAARQAMFILKRDPDFLEKEANGRQRYHERRRDDEQFEAFMARMLAEDEEAETGAAEA